MSEDVSNKTVSPIHQFSLETASESLNDLDLRIIPVESHNHTTSHLANPNQQKSSPRWIRKRILTENDEIVDQLVDVHSRSLSWSSHRPTRGWYLHLRCPTLPPKVYLPLLTPKRTSVDSAFLGGTPLSFSVTTRLQLSKISALQERIEIFDGSGIHPSTQQSQPEHNNFTSVNLNLNEPSATEASSTAATVDTGAVRTTGVESGASSSKGHARRRSGGRGSSSINKQRIISNPSSTPTVPEEDSVGDLSQASTMVEEETTNNNPSSDPRRCTMLLTDSVAFSSALITTSEQANNSTNQESWTNWARKLIPQIVQPLSGLSGSKSFSIFWIDAPGIQSDSQATRKIEILRFVDQSAWLSWKSRQIGQMFIQQNAIETLNVDVGLWIAVALAYLEFLEERDGYNAASDG